MFFKKSRPQPASLAPDVEKGPKTHTDEPPVESERNAGATGEPSTEDDSDSNDKFWKLFLEEAASEAKWKVSIWQTELDSLLVFAGLFAGIVSAFLVDLRSHLRPDPQVVVLLQITSILRNQTGPITSDSDLDSGPSASTLAVGYLWYGSLVATLIGALWGVLAKGWLGETLREPPNNPVDRALERWRRDKAVKHWYMEHVITGVPLLTQIGLSMFLTGFVVQSFDDDRGIGIQVLFYVTLGTLAYAGFTFVPWFRPDCPYRTPLTKYIFGTRIIPSKGNHDANTKSKIQILISKLNRSSNDEIFCSAASVLDGKLESHDSRKWYKGVEKHASEIADALSVRLKSFAHRAQMITEGPQSLSRILKDSVSSDSNGDTFVGTFYSPIEQGIACLRVLLGSIEASITYGTDKSPWIKQDIDRQWRVSKIFPATWRMLSLSIHITKLVAKKADFKAGDIAEIDWDNLIRKTFPDMPLRSISGASACRGLMQGEANLKRACAIGVATFVEIEATTPTDSEKQVGFEEHDWTMITNASEVVTKEVWKEHVSMWKDIVLQLLRETYEWTEPENSMYELMNYALYSNDIKLFPAIFLKHLESTNDSARAQAIRFLAKFLTLDSFQEAVDIKEIIKMVLSKLNDKEEIVRSASIRALTAFGDNLWYPFMETMQEQHGITKLVGALADDSSDVRDAAISVLRGFSTYESYQDDVIASIPAIILQLDNDDSRICEQNIQLLKGFLEIEVFMEAMCNEMDGLVAKIAKKLGSGISSMRLAAFEALEALNTHEMYQNSINLSIPTIVSQMDADDWSARIQNIQLLQKFSEANIFRATLHREQFISKLIAKGSDSDIDVRTAASVALLAVVEYESYQDDIKGSIFDIMTEADDQVYWRTRVEAIQILTKLCELDVYRETMNEKQIISKFVSKLEDGDSDVRNSIIAGLSACCNHELYKDDIILAIPAIIKVLDHSDWGPRHSAVKILSAFSEHAAFREALKSTGSVTKIVLRLKDDDYDVRAAAVDALATFGTQDYFKETLKSHDIVSKIFERFSDDSERVCVEAGKGIFKLSADDFYKKDIKSLIMVSEIVKQLRDTNKATRKGAIQILTEIATNGNFREAIDAQEFYQNDFKSAVPVIMNMLEDQAWDMRQQIIQTLVKLSERSVLQEAMKVEGFVNKLAARLDDYDADVRSEAAQAMSVLAANGQFQDKIKADKGIPKLISKLADSDGDINTPVYDALLALGKQDNVTDFLQTIVVTLQTIVDKPVRAALYKLLIELKASKSASSADISESFTKEIDTTICKLLVQMQEKDFSFIRRTLTIMTEMADEDLTGSDLTYFTPSNKSIRDAVEVVVRSKLLYEKFSQSERADAVLALSRLAKNNVLIVCMKAAIPGLTEAVSSNDRNVWNVAVGAISSLSRQDDFRADLVPAVQRLVQKLRGWDINDDEQYPLNIIETMTTLVQYDEFQAKLRHVGSILLQQLQKEIRNDTLNQHNERNSIGFYQSSLKLISRLCETYSVGRELVSDLVPVLSNIHSSLTQELVDVVDSLVAYGNLTLNDRIALASSLRIVSPTPDALQTQVCKLRMAARLDEYHKVSPSFVEYRSFLGAVLGNSSETIRSKLSTLVPPKA